MSQTRYTTRQRMELLFSACGLVNQIDDAPDEEAVLNFYIDDASSEIETYCGHMYNSVDLAASEWVTIRCTWIACYRLSQRSGNGSLFYGRYEQILDELQKVQLQQLVIPEIGTKADLLPTLSNLEHDPRFRERTIRVEPEVSTGERSSKQDLSYSSLLPDWLS